MTGFSRRDFLRGAGAIGVLGAVGVAAPATALERIASSTARKVGATSLVRVRFDGMTINRLTASFDVTEHVHDGWVEVVARAGDLARLEAEGFRYEVVVDDLLGQFMSDRVAERQAAEAAPQTRQEYRTLAEHHADLDRLVSIAPGLVAPFELPTSTHQGRRIRGVTISGNVAAAATDGRATALMCGLHHAREWPSGELTIMFAEDLVDRYLAGEAETRALLDKLRLIVIPVSNPDGFVRSREAVPYNATAEGLTQYAQEGPYQRKNMRPNFGLPVEPQQGVDINRNYPYRWGGPGASGDFFSQTYHGPAPGSEPEIVALTDVFRHNQVLAAISNHTSGRLVLRPWGYTNVPGPEDDLLGALGDAMAAHNGYTSGLWNIALYPGTGIVDDWSYGLHGTLCYTLEHGTSFHPPYGANIPAMYQLNRPAYLEMVNAAVDPATHGIISGTAPAGTTLTLTKDVASPLVKASGGATSVPDRYETSMVVGPSGSYSWHVNPSPLALTLIAIEEGEASLADRESYTFNATRPDGSTLSRPLLVERGGTYRIDV